MSESASAVVTYSCDAGFAEIDQVLSRHREFMPATACPAIECQRRHGGGAGGPKNVAVGPETLVVQTRGSPFVQFQDAGCKDDPLGDDSRHEGLDCIFLPRRFVARG